MTLILTINGPETIWLLADRRLSFKNRPPKDDARKVMFLETQDSVSILGYAGLGATALGTEPSDWMSSVLRGRNLLLEQSLYELSEALKRQFPKHLVQMPADSMAAHNILVTAFVDNEVRFYTIDLVLSHDRKNYQFRYTRRQANNINDANTRTPRIGLGGTGGLFLYKNKKWMRNILDIVKASNNCQVSEQVVADQLADLNYQVHLQIGDNSVGPNCIIAWRHVKDGSHKGGGGHLFYTGVTRDNNTRSLPTIGNGMDIQAIIGILMPSMNEMVEAMKSGKPPKELDKDELNEKLSHLPDEPDENLQ